jgi:hypothetical protein
MKEEARAADAGIGTESGGAGGTGTALPRQAGREAQGRRERRLRKRVSEVVEAEIANRGIAPERSLGGFINNTITSAKDQNVVGANLLTQP